MSSDKETAYYIELQPGDKVQVWDQWLDECGQWQFFTRTGDTDGVVGQGVKARRPIRTTHQVTYEEVPGSRTTQQAADQPQRERIAYEELRPGDVIQQGDEWQNDDGRWHPLVLMAGACTQVRDGLRARRPHNIAAMQHERDELQAALIESRLAQQRKVADITEVCKERDGFDAEVQRLQEVVRNLYNGPTAKQVQDVLRTWATELDWSAGCFDSVGREQIDTIQRTLIAAMERIETMINPEVNTDGE